MIEFQIGENRTASGYLALPEGGKGPGILVLHAWWGLTDFVKSVCDRLAGEGWVALAPDFYEGKTARTVAEAEQLEETMDMQEQKRVITGAVQHLKSHPAVTGDAAGVIGFSLGASWAVFLATRMEPQAFGAVVTFYGMERGLEREDYAGSRAAFQGHFSEADPFEPIEEIRQTEELIRSAGRPVEFYYYSDAGHWFVEADRPDAFNTAAAELAWKRTMDFLRRYLTEGRDLKELGGT